MKYSDLSLEQKQKLAFTLLHDENKSVIFKFDTDDEPQHDDKRSPKNKKKYSKKKKKSPKNKKKYSKNKKKYSKKKKKSKREYSVKNYNQALTPIESDEDASDEKKTTEELRTENGIRLLRLIKMYNHKIILGKIQSLLEQKNVDVNIEEKNGNTPLLLAVQKRYLGVVEALLKRSDIRLNKRVMGYAENALIFAIKNNDTEMVRLLLQDYKHIPEKIDVNVYIYDGKTPLMCAIEQGNERIVTMLLNQSNIDINQKRISPLPTENQHLPYEDRNENTALMMAVLNRKMNIVEALLEHPRMDVNMKNKQGNTALHLACDSGHIQCVKLLLQKNIDVNKENKFGDIALPIAVRRDFLDIVKLLLDKNSEHTQYALYFASCYGSMKVLNYLLDEKSVDINHVNDSGMTSLCIACYRNHTDIVKRLLLEPNIDVNISLTLTIALNQRQPPLLFALQTKNVDMVRELVRHPGINVDIEYRMDRTLVHAAIQTSVPDIIRMVLQKTNQVVDDEMLMYVFEQRVDFKIFSIVAEKATIENIVSCFIRSKRYLRTKEHVKSCIDVIRKKLINDSFKYENKELQKIEKEAKDVAHSLLNEHKGDIKTSMVLHVKRMLNIRNVSIQDEKKVFSRISALILDCVRNYTDDNANFTDDTMDFNEELKHKMYYLLHILIHLFIIPRENEIDPLIQFDKNVTDMVSSYLS